MTSSTPAPGSGAGVAAFSGVRSVAGAYLELTKPRIAMLLLVTCGASMMVAAEGIPSLSVALVTMLGLALSSGGAGALNHVYDRDIDASMRRTASRPIVTGVVSPRAGTIFGVALIVIAAVLLWFAVNPLTSVLTTAGGLFYAVVYTMILKRRTVQNIVIGGAAGAMPPLVGWAAVTGTVGWTGFWLFVVIFLWTPPHFWALALLVREEYARADVPMLPVVAGERRTAIEILVYTVLLLGASVVPVVQGGLGMLYGVAAIVLGTRFVVLAGDLLLQVRADDAAAARQAARRVFLFSLTYLGVLFLAAVADALLM